MISLSVVILFFVVVFFGLFLIFGATRAPRLNKGHHPHRKMTIKTKK